MIIFDTILLISMLKMFTIEAIGLFKSKFRERVISRNRNVGDLPDLKIYYS